jgi:hypothetical protein
MHRYRVYRACIDDGEVTLHDSGGRYHVARALSAVPAVGADLEGSLPGLGLRVLRCAATGLDYRVSFESIDCDRLALPRVSRAGAAP